MTALSITPQNLLAFNPTLPAGRAALYAHALNAAVQPIAGVAAVDDISASTLRLRHFMAQIAQESGGFYALEERFGYKPETLFATFKCVQSLDHAKALLAQGPQAVADCVYANRLGNGPSTSGDGYRFRGRGFIQVTGRSNYGRLAGQMGLKLLDDPDLLLDPMTAARATVQFWRNRHINLAADADCINEVTRLVNGGENGLDDRKTRYQAALRQWPDDISQDRAA
jgi:putative chitinase